MRNAREIYIKLREVKYHYLIKLYKKLLKKIPTNCKYNHPYKFAADSKEIEIRLCLLHQPNVDLKSGVFPHLIDLCQEPLHCINCNAFIFKHTKESIKEKFNNELKDPKVKAEKYPDICALEWTLDEKPVELKWLDNLYLYFRYLKK